MKPAELTRIFLLLEEKKLKEGDYYIKKPKPPIINLQKKGKKIPSYDM